MLCGFESYRRCQFIHLAQSGKSTWLRTKVSGVQISQWMPNMPVWVSGLNQRFAKPSTALRGGPCVRIAAPAPINICSLDATGSVSPLQGGSCGFESLSEYQICRIIRSGLRTRLENAGYGDEPYGDRHLSSAPATGVSGEARKTLVDDPLIYLKS